MRTVLKITKYNQKRLKVAFVLGKKNIFNKFKIFQIVIAICLLALLYITKMRFVLILILLQAIYCFFKVNLNFLIKFYVILNFWVLSLLLIVKGWVVMILFNLIVMVVILNSEWIFNIEFNENYNHCQAIIILASLGYVLIHVYQVKEILIFIHSLNTIKLIYNTKLQPSKSLHVLKRISRFSFETKRYFTTTKVTRGPSLLEKTTDMFVDACNKVAFKKYEISYGQQKITEHRLKPHIRTFFETFSNNAKKILKNHSKKIIFLGLGVVCLCDLTLTNSYLNELAILNKLELESIKNDITFLNLNGFLNQYNILEKIKMFEKQRYLQNNVNSLFLFKIFQPILYKSETLVNIFLNDFSIYNFGYSYLEIVPVENFLEKSENIAKLFQDGNYYSIKNKHTQKDFCLFTNAMRDNFGNVIVDTRLISLESLSNDNEKVSEVSTLIIKNKN